MGSTWKDLLNSKKARVALVAVVLRIAAFFGVDASPELQQVTTEIVAIVVAWLVGQGIADGGKERARIEGETQVKLRQMDAAEWPRG